jgi:hypothetical protein
VAIRFLRAALPAAVVSINLLVLCRLVCMALLGPWLARLNPRALDPEWVMPLLLADVLWVAPVTWGLLFLGFRGQRLENPRAWLAAAGAWTTTLLLREVFFLGGLGAVRSQVAAHGAFADWGLAQGIAVSVLLAAAALFGTVELAWGSGGLLRRCLRVSALMLGALVSGGLVAGGNAMLQLTLGQYLERTQRVTGAVWWYERALGAERDPELLGWVRHRVGRLHYQRGDLEGARRSWNEQISGGAEGELANFATYYLENLEESRLGRRVVLEGSSATSERRRSYCAPNTLAIAFGVLGRPTRVSELAEQATALGEGTQIAAIRRAASDAGFDLELMALAPLDEVYELIDAGLPALVFVPGHVLAVVGYDEQLGTLLTYDTARHDLWVDRPVEHLEKEWARGHWTLGVVVPRGTKDPRWLAALARFRSPLTRATAAWRLGLQEPRGELRNRRMRQALLADPTFFPAAAELIEESMQDDEALAWILAHADPVGIEQRARDLLGRRGGVRVAGRALAVWLEAREDWSALADLADEVSQLGAKVVGIPYTGTAAARAGDLEAATYLLEEAAAREALDAAATMALIDVRLDLGQSEAAAALLLEWIATARSDDLERAVQLAETLALRPASLAKVYSVCLEARPHDVAAALRLAEISAVAALDEPDRSREHQQRTRAATTLAVALHSGQPGAEIASEGVDRNARLR